MYKVQNNLAPDYLNAFKNVNNVHSRNTRSAAREDLYIPKHRTQFYKKSVTYSGVKNMEQFTSRLKVMFLIAVFQRQM